MENKKEKRLHERIESKLPIIFTFDDPRTNKRIESGKLTLNISKGGLFFESKNKFEVGDIMSLKMNVIKDVINCKGKVVRIEEEEKDNKITYKVGIELLDISDTDRNKIEEYAKNQPI